MSEKTNREKMLDEEEYFPDKELADLAYNKYSPALVKEKPKRGCIIMKEKRREYQVTDSAQTVPP